MSQQPIYDYVMRHLDAKRQHRKVVAQGSGVPYSTVCKVAQREVLDPSVHTVQKLRDYFAALDGETA